MLRSLPAIVSAVLLALISTAEAGKVVTWRHAARADFEKGKFESVAQSAAGTLTLTRRLREVADLKAGSVWGLVRTPAGKLLAATAEPGQVVDVAGDGQISTLWKNDKAQAFSLLALADGAVLVGTGPEGKIFRIDPKGQSSEFAQVDGLYVWDLASGADGAIYAATGPKGKIIKLDRDGKSAVFYETKQQHVLSLALAADGALVAGTDGPGLVLKITPQGTGRVLYDAGGAEIRSLWVEGEAIFAGTAGGNSAGGATASLPAIPTAGDSPAAGRGTSSVFRIDGDGGVTRVLSAQGLVYSLASLGKDSILAGTGPQGILYVTEPAGASRQLARLDAEQILSMSTAPDGEIRLGTGSPGKVFALSREFELAGTITSEPLDAKMVAHFGAVNWSADTPPQTQVTIALRSGNTAKPGDAWSNWSDELSDPAQATAACPAGRFLQYRVSLKTKDPKVTPELRSLSIRYRTANQAPAINTLTVPHVEEGDGKKPLTKLKLAWTAADPNSDELTYDIHFRKPEWKSWVKLQEKQTASDLEWDVTSVPEGVYQVRVTATDAGSNPADEAQAVTRISEPFIVDCQGPAIELKVGEIRNGKEAIIEAKSQDKHSPIASASYSLDSGAWVNVFPQDRLFDAATERFRFDVTGLTPGVHVLVFRSTDAAGHTTSADVVFTTEGAAP